MSRSLVILLILIVATLTLAPIPQVRGATLYVGPTTNCGLPTAYPDVASALVDAVDGDTIVICESFGEGVTNLVIDKNVTIDGLFNGTVHSWGILDTDETNPALTIVANVTFKNMDMILHRASTNPPNEFINVSNGNATFQDMQVRYYQDNLRLTSMFYVDNGQINIVDTIVKHFPGISFTPLGNIFSGKNGNLTILRGNIQHSVNGKLIDFKYDGAVTDKRFVNILDTWINSIWSVGTYFTFNGPGDVELNVVNSTIYLYNRLIVALMSNGGNLDVNIMDSRIFMASNGMYFSLESGSTVNLYVNPSFLRSAGSIGYVSLTNSQFYGTFLSSTLHARTSYTFRIWATLNSYAMLEILNTTVLSSFNHVLLLQSLGGSIIDTFIIDSLFNASYGVPSFSSSAVLDVNNGGVLNFNVENSILSSPYNVLDVSAYNGEIWLSLLYTTLLPWSYEVALSIYAGISGVANLVADHSNIGIFVLDGPGDIYLRLFETVYNEMFSISAGFPVYSEWTLAVLVLSSLTMQPVFGAYVSAAYLSSVMGFGYTDASGIAYITLKYNYDSNNPVIQWLRIGVKYKGAKNGSFYHVFEQNNTMPYWYGSITMMLPAAIFRASLAGSSGYGIFNLYGNHGVLILGPKDLGGTQKYIPAWLVNIQRVGDFLKMDIKLNIDGAWVDGYLLARLDTGFTYLKVGSIEMYGFIIR